MTLGLIIHNSGFHSIAVDPNLVITQRWKESHEPVSLVAYDIQRTRHRLTGSGEWVEERNTPAGALEMLGALHLQIASRVRERGLAWECGRILALRVGRRESILLTRRGFVQPFVVSLFGSAKDVSSSNTGNIVLSTSCLVLRCVGSLLGDALV